MPIVFQGKRISSPVLLCTHTYIWISSGLQTSILGGHGMHIGTPSAFLGLAVLILYFLEYILLRLIGIACIGKVIFSHELGFFILPQFKYIFNCVHIIR